MKKRSILFPILTTLALAVICLIVLVLAAGKLNSSKSGFNRKNPINELVKNNSLELKGTSFLNICGIFHDRYYFSTTDIHKIIETDTNLSVTRTIQVSFNSVLKSYKLDTLHFITYIDNQDLTIFLLNEKIILKGDQNGGINKIFYVDRYFNNSVPISTSSIVIKGFDKERKNLLFSRVNLFTNGYLEESKITDKVDDGGFATDGVLSYQKEDAYLTYTNYYSNKIIVFDTNMNIISIRKSLDTFSQYQASAVRLGSSDNPGGYSLDKPPKFINGWNSVFENKLYLCSYISAENENPSIAPNNDVIDVFELGSGRYLESVYVPFFHGKRLANFLVTKKTILVIYPGGVLSYHRSN